MGNAFFSPVDGALQSMGFGSNPRTENFVAQKMGANTYNPYYMLQKYGVDFSQLGTSASGVTDPYLAMARPLGFSALTGSATPQQVASAPSFAPQVESYVPQASPSFTPQAVSYAPPVSSGGMGDPFAVPVAPSPSGVSGVFSYTGADMGNVLRWQPQVDAAIERVFQETGVEVPASVIYATMELESGGEQVGYNDAGYGGLMQVGPGSNVSNWDYDYAATPEGNIYYGAQELANWYGVTGDWNTAPLAYFSGYNYDNPGASDGHYTVADYNEHVQSNLADLGGINGQPASGQLYGFAAPSVSQLGPNSRADVQSLLAGGMSPTEIRAMFAPGMSPAAPIAPGPTVGAGAWINSMTGGVQHPITQEYGMTDFAVGNEDYVYTADYSPDGQLIGHAGLDIGMDVGAPLFSPVTGVVVQAGGVDWEQDERYGATPGTGGFRVQLPNGDIVVMGHMQEIDLQVGDTVTAGQQVGYSGTSNGGHVHLEYRQYTPGATASGYTNIDPRLVDLGSVTAPAGSAFTANTGRFVTPRPTTGNLGAQYAEAMNAIGDPRSMGTGAQTTTRSIGSMLPQPKPQPTATQNRRETRATYSTPQQPAYQGGGASYVSPPPAPAPVLQTRPQGNTGYGNAIRNLF